MLKRYYLVLDVEGLPLKGTGNLTYDIGYAITDRHGKIYLKRSFVVSDVFFGDGLEVNSLMSSAYYSDKIPEYLNGIKTGEFVTDTFAHIKSIIHADMRQYRVKHVAAYYATYDIRALETTNRWLGLDTPMFDEHINIIDIYHMACCVLCNTYSYVRWCVQHERYSDKLNCSTKAEDVYRYLTKDVTFNERHTGLADVLIEVQIMKKCFDKHKKMSTEINSNAWKIPQEKFKKALTLKRAQPFYFFIYHCNF